MINQERLALYTEIIDKHKEHILALSRAHGVSIGKKRVNGVETGEICLTLHVHEKIDESKLNAEDIFGKFIAGINADIITDVEESLLPRLEFKKVLITHVDAIPDTNKYRPLIGGCRLATRSEKFYHFGTGGFIGKSAISSEQKCIVTNYHVVRDSMNNKVYQPSVTEEDYIGDVGNTAYSTKVDGAQVKLGRGINTENKITEIGEVKGTKTPALDDKVEKYGYITTLTTGIITGINYAGKSSGGRDFTNQVIISKRDSTDPRISDSGDSGSAWVLSGENKITALHWGGDGIGDKAYACPIGDVESELGITVATS